MRIATFALCLAASLLAPAASVLAAEQWETRTTQVPNGGVIVTKTPIEGNVVEFQVLAVSVPTRLPNYCAVSAMVTRVWEGKAWREGMPLALNVPCAEYGLVPSAAHNDGFTPVNARSLQQSTQGIARLSDNGELLWQGGLLKQYGQWGTVAGYRVLDVRMLPARVKPS